MNIVLLIGKGEINYLLDILSIRLFLFFDYLDTRVTNSTMFLCLQISVYIVSHIGLFVIGIAISRRVNGKFSKGASKFIRLNLMLFC